MIKFFKSRQQHCLMLKCFCVSLLLPCFAFAEAISIEKTHKASDCYSETASCSAPTAFNNARYGELELIFQGPYFSLYTSGRLIKQGSHSKSGVWNVRARKLKELWLKRAESGQLIRLDPKTFRHQLLELFSDFPELYRALLQKSFTYKGLPHNIRELNDHIAKVIIIRRKKVDLHLEKVIR